MRPPWDLARGSKWGPHAEHCSPRRSPHWWTWKPCGPGLRPRRRTPTPPSRTTTEPETPFMSSAATPQARCFGGFGCPISAFLVCTQTEQQAVDTSRSYWRPRGKACYLPGENGREREISRGPALSILFTSLSLPSRKDNPLRRGVSRGVEICFRAILAFLLWTRLQDLSGAVVFCAQLLCSTKHLRLFLCG